MKPVIRRVLLFATIGTLLIDTRLCQQQPTVSSTVSSSSSTVSATLPTANSSSVVGSNFSTPAAVAGPVTIVQGPPDQTVMAASTVNMNVGLSGPYTGRIIWRVARSDSSGSVKVADSQFNLSPNFQLSSQNLTIVMASWKDGGTYTVFLSDTPAGTSASATLVVIDSITPSISPNITKEVMSSNASITVNLTCTVVYGGPDGISSDRAPQLFIALGSQDLTNASTSRFTQGVSGVAQSILTRTISYTLMPYQTQNNKLECTVRTANPSYNQTAVLHFHPKPEIPDDPSKQFDIQPKKDEYDIDDIITCNVSSTWPEAQAVWEPVNSPGSQWVDEYDQGRLVVDKDMLPGEHTWECLAIDPLNNTLASYQFTFNVSGHHAGWWYDEEAERQKRIGLGIGLGLGLFFLLIIIILIIYCCVVKKRRDRRPPTVSKQAPSDNTTAGYRPLDNNPGSEYIPSQAPPPIYQPKAAAAPPLTGRGAGSPAPSDLNAVPLLERSGHGDLGGSVSYRPQSPAVRSSTSTVASSVRPNGNAPDAGSNTGFADLGPVAGPPSANRSMLSHNTSVISSGASSIVDPGMQQSSRPLSNRTYMSGGPRDSGRDQLIPPSSGHATGV